MYDLIIVGGGATGLAAAYYATGKRLNFVMICENLGGKIGWLDSLSGADYRQFLPGNELARLLATRATAPSSPVLQDQVKEITKHDTRFVVTTAASGTWESRAVLVATGATPLRLEVPGEERFADHGLGYSITTYAHFAAGRRVAVIGATGRALNGAVELARVAERVFLVAPQILSGPSPLVDVLRQQPNVEVLEGCAMTEIAGTTSADTVVFVRAGKTQRLPVHGVFVALGLIPNSALVGRLVERDVQGFIRVTPAHETSVAGLFAAGDVATTMCENVLIAIGDGVQAARSAFLYLLAQPFAPLADSTGEAPQ